MTKISKFDAADYLKTPAARAAYLDEAFAIDDAAYIRTALNTVARAKAQVVVAKQKGPGKTGAFDIGNTPKDQRE
jgi:probable addiction module antidote protein